MEDLKFNKEEVSENLLNNKHNQITTTYYLLLKLKIRRGLTSVSDLMSYEFIKFINNPKNFKLNAALKNNNENLKNDKNEVEEGIYHKKNQTSLNLNYIICESKPDEPNLNINSKFLNENKEFDKSNLNPNNLENIKIKNPQLNDLINVKKFLNQSNQVIKFKKDFKNLSNQFFETKILKENSNRKEKMRLNYINYSDRKTKNFLNNSDYKIKNIKNKSNVKKKIFGFSNLQSQIEYNDKLNFKDLKSIKIKKDIEIPFSKNGVKNIRTYNMLNIPLKNKKKKYKINLENDIISFIDDTSDKKTNFNEKYYKKELKKHD